MKRQASDVKTVFQMSDRPLPTFMDKPLPVGEVLRTDDQTGRLRLIIDTTRLTDDYYETTIWSPR